MKKNLPITQNEVRLPQGKYIVSRTTIKGVITDVNDVFVQVSGFSREELIGQSHNIVRHPDMPQAAFKNLWDTLKKGQPWRGVVKNRCKNGDFYWVDALVIPLRENRQLVGYTSVRKIPTRSQIAAAEQLYAALNAGRIELPAPGRQRGLSLRLSQGLSVAAMLVAQALLLAMVASWYQRAAITPAQAALLAAGLFVSMVAAVWTGIQQKTVLQAIKDSLHELDALAQGVLTADVAQGGHHEIGRINTDILVAQTHLKALVSDISDASEVVGTNVSHVAVEMRRARDVSTMQTAAAGNIAAAVEELSCSVKEIARNAENASTAVDASQDLIHQAMHMIDESQAASQSVVLSVSEAGKTMAALFQSISAIDRVSQVIREIADQTNLLALNAAIEAARAGDSGRGFAVVADEVRKLAERSSAQTIEITSSIQDIQKITQVALSAMELAGAQVIKTNQALSKVHGAMTSIGQHGQQVDIISKEIAEGTRQQSEASSEVASQIEGIASGIAHNSQMIADISEQCMAMNKAAAQLKKSIGRFQFID